MTSSSIPAGWTDRLTAALRQPPSREADLALSSLAYEAVGTKNPEVIDHLISVFTSGLDSSVLQSYLNALGSVPFDDYRAAYVRNLELLLRAAPRWAVSLLDYPGAELSANQCEQLVAEIQGADHGSALLNSLDAQIEALQLSGQHPWSAILRRRRNLPAS